MSIEGSRQNPSESAVLLRFSERLRAAIVALSALFVLLFLYAAARRMYFPYEVEWIESGVLVSVLRIVHGQGLYVAPTADYVAYLYAPLYFYLSATIMKFAGAAGHGYAALRLLSTLSTLGTFAAIYALVRTETRRHLPAIAAAGLYAACYPVLGLFYDTGRVDALFVFLMLLALLAQRRGYPVLAAILWALVFQTKQSVLPLATIILCAEWQRPRKMVAALVTFFTIVAVTFLAFNHATGGWYVFYMFHVAGGLPIVPRQLILFWPFVLLPTSIAWTLIFGSLWLAPVRLRSSRTQLFLLASLAIYPGFWFVASHDGASANADMPVFAFTAVLFGIALARLLDWADIAEALQAQVLLMIAVALQLFALLYNPGRYLPTRASVALGQQFIDQVRDVPGDVYVFNHSYDAILAGKQPHAEGEALHAVLNAGGPVASQLRAEVNAALVAHRYSAIVVDVGTPSGDWLPFTQDYPQAVSSASDGLAFLTSKPHWFLLPCSASVTEIHQSKPEGTVLVPGTCSPR